MDRSCPFQSFIGSLNLTVLRLIDESSPQGRLHHRHPHTRMAVTATAKSLGLARGSPVYSASLGRSRDGRESRESRDGRESRESRDARDSGRESRPVGHSRDHDYRYRERREQRQRRQGSRQRRLRPILPRGGSSSAEEYYRRKDEPYRDPYRDPWNGRPPASLASAVDDRARPEERRRNELYRQYYEELQRRYDTDRPVDCSVIVVNKAQKEYAETVGRKVLSLTQALEDVGRQHQVHRSCTVNILFGTPNFCISKVFENREKEREEIARKAAKMADDVLLREPDRESHPVSVLTSITLLSENRFVTPDEMDTLIAYLKDKRARLLRSAAEPLTGKRNFILKDWFTSCLFLLQYSLKRVIYGHHSSSTYWPWREKAFYGSMQKQSKVQLQLISGFSETQSGSQPPAGAAGQDPQPVQQRQRGPGGRRRPAARQGLRLPRPIPRPDPTPPNHDGPSHDRPLCGRAPGLRRPTGTHASHTRWSKTPSSASGINFDNPSVQKALDTLIQSGPSLNHLVSPAAAQQPPTSMGQVPPLSMYPRHY
uniref:Nuclear receptor coactivator 5 n=1 Tax=Cyclopterus lumpus TaxID=8103 RepID=A0A8C3A1W0_CYCLU